MNLAFAAPATVAPAVLADAFVTPQGISTLRMASAVYQSGLSDSPASTSWPARVLGDVVVSQSAVDAIGVGGRVALGLADIDLWNADGALDDAIRYGTADGRAVAVRVAAASAPHAGDVGCAYGDTVLAFAGTVRAIEGQAALRARLSITDIGQRLATPLQTALYLGTGAAEGPASLAGTPKPVALGQVFNAAPVALGNVDLGDGALPTYQTHWRAIAGHDAVRIRGVAQAAVTGTAPALGEYRDWPALGLFQIGSSPDGPVTADLRGDAVPFYVNTTASVLRRLIQSLGPAYADDEMQSDSFTFAEVDLPGTIGWYRGSQAVTAAAAVEEILAGCGAVLCGGRGGQMRLFDPLASDAVQFDLPAACILDLQPISLPAGLRPLPRAVGVAWAKNWAPSANLAGSVDDADRAALSGLSSGPARATSDTITTRVAQQRDLTFPGLYATEADALARAETWRDWLAAGPRFFEVITDRYLGQIECGDIGRLTYPAYGLDAGTRGTVIAWTEALGGRRLTLTFATLPEA